MGPSAAPQERGSDSPPAQPWLTLHHNTQSRAGAQYDSLGCRCWLAQQCSLLPTPCSSKHRKSMAPLTTLPRANALRGHVIPRRSSSTLSQPSIIRPRRLRRACRHAAIVRTHLRSTTAHSDYGSPRTTLKRLHSLGCFGHSHTSLRPRLTRRYFVCWSILHRGGSRKGRRSSILTRYLHPVF